LTPIHISTFIWEKRTESCVGQNKPQKNKPVALI
jgi:hypothetical protein